MPIKLVLLRSIHIRIRNNNPNTTLSTIMRTYNTKLWQSSITTTNRLSNNNLTTKINKTTIKNTKNSKRTSSQTHINNNTNTSITTRSIRKNRTNNTLFNKISISIKNTNTQIRKRTTTTHKPRTIKQHILRPTHRLLRNKSTRSSLIHTINSTNLINIRNSHSQHPL